MRACSLPVRHTGVASARHAAHAAPAAAPARGEAVAVLRHRGFTILIFKAAAAAAAAAALAPALAPPPAPAPAPATPAAHLWLWLELLGSPWTGAAHDVLQPFPQYCAAGAVRASEPGGERLESMR